MLRLPLRMGLRPWECSPSRRARRLQRRRRAGGSPDSTRSSASGSGCPRASASPASRSGSRWAAELFGASGREGEKKLDELRRDRSCADRQRFAETLHARGLLDFYDPVELPVRLLRESPEAVRAFRERFGWISVDEYQDVDREQYELVKLLSGPEGNVCVIGDPDQAIA